MNMRLIRQFIQNQKGIAPIFIMLILSVGILIGLYLMKNPQIFSPKAAEPTSNTVDIRRLYNPKHNTWYWADNQTEINNLVSNGFQDARTLFSAFIDGKTPGTVPLYRLIKINDYYWPGNELFLTTNTQEVDLVLSQGNNTGGATDNMDRNQPITSEWQIKDAALYVYPPTNPASGSVPVYRMIYNNPQDPKFDGDRYYVVAQEEIEALMATGKYINEGIVFYGAGEPTFHVPNDPTPARTPVELSAPNFGEKTLAYCDGKNSRVHLEWDQVPGTTSYKIFRSTTEPGSGAKIQELEHFAYNDEAVKANVNYAYYIEAVTANGSVIGKTKTLTAVSCN